MKELSLHILDIFQNSLSAGAENIGVTVDIDTRRDRILLSISDDGCGMDSAMLALVTDPFTTSRQTRTVGLGLPLLKQAAQAAGGELSISSEPKVGTTVSASFGLHHIDRMPIGDMASTVAAMAASLGSCELTFTQRLDQRSFTFDTREIREVLGSEVALSEGSVLNWIKENIEEEYAELGFDPRSC